MRITTAQHAITSDTPLARIAKVYETETYDYPTQVQESITQLSTTIGHGITNFAATSLKGTNLPAPSPVASAPVQHKTLPHALGRAATTAATTLQGASGGVAGDDKLARAMGVYASAWEKVCAGTSRRAIIALNLIITSANRFLLLESSMTMSFGPNSFNLGRLL